MSLTFTSLPLEIYPVVFAHSDIQSLTFAQKAKAEGKFFLNLSLTSKFFKDLFENKLKQQQNVYKLKNKYHKYNEKYKTRLKNIEELEQLPKNKQQIHKMFVNCTPTGGPPQLLDAVFTRGDNSLGLHSCTTYNEEVEADIKALVTLMPDSLHCILGEIRCRENLTPLVAACWNSDIPLSIIEFLLQSGAKADVQINVCCKDTPFLEDLQQYGKNKERFKAISDLFKKYGHPVPAKKEQE